MRGIATGERGAPVNMNVIEFELTCESHGAHRTIVPAELPRPRHCMRCFLPVSDRRELRRFATSDPLPNYAGGEAWFG